MICCMLMVVNKCPFTGWSNKKSALAYRIQLQMYISGTTKQIDVGCTNFKASPIAVSRAIYYLAHQRFLCFNVL